MSDFVPRRHYPAQYHSIEERQKAIECFEAGLSHRKTAERLGISEYLVRDWHRLYVRGKFHAQLQERCLWYTDETKTAVLERLQAGASYGQIARETGIPAATVQRWAETAAEKENSPGRKKGDF